MSKIHHEAGGEIHSGQAGQREISILELTTVLQICILQYVCLFTECYSIA